MIISKIVFYFYFIWHAAMLTFSFRNTFKLNFSLLKVKLEKVNSFYSIQNTIITLKTAVNALALNSL